MADDDAKPSPSTTIPDPFAGAKASLRDTIKWLATTFAAVIGVVIAGTSLSGISKLTGINLELALTGGIVGLACIVLATGVMLRLLVPHSFYFGELLQPENDALLRRLNRHAIEILPPEIADIETFVARRDMAVQQIRRGVNDPNSSEYQLGSTFLDDIQGTLASLTYLAHYEKLRENLHRAEPTLFVLALGAICGLGVFAVFTGTAKDPPAPAPRPAITNVSFDGQRSPFGLPSSAATQNQGLSGLLSDALHAGVTKEGGSASKPTAALQPILGLIQSLAAAGALPKEVADTLQNELIKNAVEGGREILPAASLETHTDNEGAAFPLPCRRDSATLRHTGSPRSGNSGLRTREVD